MLSKAEIYLGDCKDILKWIPANSIDLIFTSPPYADQYGEKNIGIFHKSSLKVLINRYVAFGADCRFFNYSGEKDKTYNGWNYHDEINTNIHHVFFGFSILLKAKH